MKDLIKILGVVFCEAWKSYRRIVLGASLLVWMDGWLLAPFYSNIHFTTAFFCAVSPAVYFIVRFVYRSVVNCYRNTFQFFCALRVIRCYELLTFISICEKFDYDIIRTFMEDTCEAWRTLPAYPHRILTAFLQKEGIYQDDLRFVTINKKYREILSHKEQYLAIARHLPADNIVSIFRKIAELKSDPENNHCINFHLTVSDEELKAVYDELLSILDKSTREMESRIIRTFMKDTK